MMLVSGGAAPAIFSGMAVTESREVVIEATPEEIKKVLFDIEALPEWSSVHRKVEVLERDEEGHPVKSKQVVKLVGVADEQELAYEVHDDGVSWTLIKAKQQRAQEGRVVGRVAERAADREDAHLPYASC